CDIFAVGGGGTPVERRPMWRYARQAERMRERRRCGLAATQYGDRVSTARPSGAQPHLYRPPGGALAAGRPIDQAWRRRSSRRKAMTLRKFIIERDIPKVGTFEREQLRQAAGKANEVLRHFGSHIQGVG